MEGRYSDERCGGLIDDTELLGMTFGALKLQRHMIGVDREIAAWFEQSDVVYVPPTRVFSIKKSDMFEDDLYVELQMSHGDDMICGVVLTSLNDVFFWKLGAEQEFSKHT
jgi:hypothetical protein